MSKRPWREGIATKNPAFARGMPIWWAWLPVYVGFTIATRWFEDAGSRMGAGGAYGLALLLGAFWQLVDPHDLAERLTVIAGLAVVVGLVLLVPMDGSASLVRDDTRHFVLVVPLIAGLVLAERWRRLRARTVRD
ncbi:hypothetical protein [Nocardioides jejuensis]|uniref:Uncharacterized protein n=1 Tax=Nocardioides jejuensis TaxID=2502782 RepID=A0A4R1CL85_9ACTN|nr:hypothetical protein [Nocardioides jejuensis]TCJ30798.1 hypothetical protein EPD65_01815 [Nocardioides jejuensis]